MPDLIDLRRRIKSVKNIQKITKAMKTVSTAKFKKAQKAVLTGRPSWHGFPDLMADIASWAERTSHPLLEERRENKIYLLVISSDKGLCGAFNHNVLEQARVFFEKKSTDAEVRLLLTGKKSVLFFADLPGAVEWSAGKDLNKFTDTDYSELARRLINHYAMYRTDAIYVAYNEFKSILAPLVTITKLLPIEEAEGREEQEIKKGEVDYEPGTETLLETLLPLFIEDQIRHFFSESFAAEHAARMMAMDNATKNAGEMIDNLTLILNKIRQSMITNELLEIMTAVEALSKK